jgi:hypothetical protein
MAALNRYRRNRLEGHAHALGSQMPSGGSDCSRKLRSLAPGLRDAARGPRSAVIR